MIRSTILGGALLIAALLSDAVQAQTSDLVSKSALRVCADPANMPFSNEAGEGYENKIAELLAEKLGWPLQYEWFPMATGFVRRTLRENRCDVIIGYAQGHELVLNTNHYYVSTHALVVDPEGPYADVETLADPVLKDARLGVVAGSPVATHAAKNGLIGKAKPYNLMVDRRVEDPSGDMLADLRSGEIDGALMWGPIGGYHAAHGGREMKVIPLTAEKNVPKLFYRITMGVRQGELVWKRKLNSLIRRNQDEIDAILREYGVPLVDEYGAPLTDDAQ
jgi:quinoprotein dehydrogenase-associated probable ABC transporter substrate-binding protein